MLDRRFILAVGAAISALALATPSSAQRSPDAFLPLPPDAKILNPGTEYDILECKSDGGPTDKNTFGVAWINMPDVLPANPTTKITDRNVRQWEGKDDFETGGDDSTIPDTSSNARNKKKEPLSVFLKGMTSLPNKGYLAVHVRIRTSSNYTFHDLGYRHGVARADKSEALCVKKSVNTKNIITKGGYYISKFYVDLLNLNKGDDAEFNILVQVPGEPNPRHIDPKVENDG